VKRALLLLSWLFLRNWRRHPVRQALSVVSISLGVALYLSTALTTGAITEAVGRAEGTLSAGVDLVVARPVAGFSSAELDALAARPEFAAVSGVIQVHARTPGGSGLTLLGIDPVRDAAVRELEGHVRFVAGGPLRFLADPFALVLTAEAQERLGLSPGGQVELTTASGRRTFTVAGTLDVPAPARAALRAYGFLPLPAAQALFGRRGRVDRADVRLGPGTGFDEGERAARAAVGPGVLVSRPAEMLKESLGAFGGMRAVLVLNSLLTLLVAVFFIYNTVSASVAERAREIGLLRSLGLGRWALVRLLLGEAVALGLVGYAVGLALGHALARGSLGIMVDTVGTLFLDVPPVESLSPTPAGLVAAAALSLGTSVVAAALAVWPLVRPAPLELLQGVALARAAGRRMRRSAVIGALVFGGTLALLLAAPEGWPVGRPSALLLPAGLALMAPAVVVALARRLRRRLAGHASPPLWLALDATQALPARTAMTVIAFALSLGLVVGHAGLDHAMVASLEEWLDHSIPGDLILTSNAASPVSLFPFSEEALEPVRKLEGVEAVARMRARLIGLPDRKASCLAVDMEVLGRRSRYDFTAGDAADVYRRCVAGEAVFVSENLARPLRVGVGDPLTLLTADGPVALPIAGVARDYNSPIGTVYLDLALYRRLFRDPLIDFGELCLAPAARADLAGKAREARAALPEGFGFIEVVPKPEFVDLALRVVRDLNHLSFVNLSLAVVIGAVGIIVTVTLSVLRRARELALLRAVGMALAGLRRTVLWEVLGLAAASALLGLVLGNLAFIPGNLLMRELAGFDFGYRFPGAWMAAAVGVAVVTALVSSVLPLRRVRAVSVRALEEE
jgi:putative ABC transport system permease protein